ncbi:hypothetical protein TMEN_9144 [Trichophyton mentagrophytes]|nr:hypothetical protein TMEN_9144 [Trichophyton mentagrophytes]
MKLSLIVSMMLAATGFAATLGARNNNPLADECPVDRPCNHNQDCAARYCRCVVDNDGKNGRCRPWPS